MEQLITDIEAFCERHGMAESRFGELAMGDKPFVKQVREGRSVQMRTAEKVRAFMASYEAEARAA
jgi:hypothetical protein